MTIPKVKEWRVTIPLRYGMTARLWIDGERGQAAAIVPDGYGDNPEDSCEALFDANPAANSVEVCDTLGYGVCLHRDWP